MNSGNRSWLIACGASSHAMTIYSTKFSSRFHSSLLCRSATLLAWGIVPSCIHTYAPLHARHPLVTYVLTQRDTSLRRRRTSYNAACRHLTRQLLPAIDANQCGLFLPRTCRRSASNLLCNNVHIGLAGRATCSVLYAPRPIPQIVAQVGDLTSTTECLHVHILPLTRLLSIMARRRPSPAEGDRTSVQPANRTQQRA
jgi:hypothetical protein